MGWVKKMSDDSDRDLLLSAQESAHAEWVRGNLEDEVERLTSMLTKVNYIATYQAQCIDGNQVTANLALSDVPEGASPGSLIEIITEKAYADIARSGMNATSILVLNLSRVW